MYSRFCASCLSSTTGPMSVPFLRASSTFSAFIFSAIAAMKRSWMPSVTIRREEAVQRWPVEKKPLLHRRVHRDVEVGVVEHHHRVLAAHLQLELGHARDAGLRDALAGGHRAGEADRVDAFVVQQRLADFASRGPSPG